MICFCWVPILMTISCSHCAHLQRCVCTAHAEHILYAAGGTDDKSARNELVWLCQNWRCTRTRPECS